MQDRLLGVKAHVSLARPGTGGIRNYEELIKKFADLPGVKSIVPSVYQNVLLSFGGDARGVVAKGVDPERERRYDEALQRIIAGTLDFSRDPDGIEALVIGKQLSLEWKIKPGDYVTLTSPQGRLTPFGMVPRTRRFRVTGVFDSGFYDYDENWCFMTLGAAQELSGTGDIVNVLEFRLAQPELADQFGPASLELEAGESFAASTWMEENRALFRALRLEKLVTAIFIGLITFVAGLNVLVVLSMTVTDKARDIAVLMSMGTRRHQIRRIFLLQELRSARRYVYQAWWSATRFRLFAGNVSFDSARSAGVLGAVRSISSQRLGRSLDHRRGDGDFDRSDTVTGASGIPSLTSRNPPFWVSSFGSICVLNEDRRMRTSNLHIW